MPSTDQPLALCVLALRQEKKALNIARKIQGSRRKALLHAMTAVPTSIDREAFLLARCTQSAAQGVPDGQDASAALLEASIARGMGRIIRNSRTDNFAGRDFDRRRPEAHLPVLDETTTISLV